LHSLDHLQNWTMKRWQQYTTACQPTTSSLTYISETTMER